ncbi:MAG: type II toxin-antitoxin system Phd/YefM family antitoxin [Polyangiaceae bacterium]
MNTPRKIAASEFKARCLGVLDEVRATGAEVVITKRGEPVARLVPIGKAQASLRGAWKDIARVRGDIVHVDWTAEFEANR